MALHAFENVLVSNYLKAFFFISIIKYELSIFCIEKMLIYNDLCVNKCPSDTYAEDEEIVNDATGEKGVRSVCKPCTKEKCHKSNAFNHQKSFFKSLKRTIRNLFSLRD